MGSQIVNHSGTAIVAFLDFENYFNAIGLECLFEILEKFGMAKEDVRVLRQYYEHSYRWCRRAERRRRGSGCRGA